MLTNEDLKAIESIMDRRFDRVEERLDRMEERLDRVDERLDRVEERLDRVEGGLDRMDERLDRMEERLDRVEERLDRMEERLDLMDESIDRKIGESELRMSQMMDRKLEPIQNEIHMIRVDLLENNVIPRLNTIEQCYLSTFNRLLCNA